MLGATHTELCYRCDRPFSRIEGETESGQTIHMAFTSNGYDCTLEKCIHCNAPLPSLVGEAKS